MILLVLLVFSLSARPTTFFKNVKKIISPPCKCNFFYAGVTFLLATQFCSEKWVMWLALMKHWWSNLTHTPIGLSREWFFDMQWNSHATCSSHQVFRVYWDTVCCWFQNFCLKSKMMHAGRTCFLVSFEVIFFQMLASCLTFQAFSLCLLWFEQAAVTHCSFGLYQHLFECSERTLTWFWSVSNDWWTSSIETVWQCFVEWQARPWRSVADFTWACSTAKLKHFVSALVIETLWQRFKWWQARQWRSAVGLIWQTYSIESASSGDKHGSQDWLQFMGIELINVSWHALHAKLRLVACPFMWQSDVEELNQCLFERSCWEKSIVFQTKLQFSWELICVFVCDLPFWWVD